MEKIQQAMIDEFEARFIFKFMMKDIINSPQSFIEAWDANISWLKDNIIEGESIILAYRNEHYE